MATDPTDSNAVIPANAPGLQQQGTIDWTKLVASTINFGVDFIVRISNGGLETLTIVAAEAVLANLQLGSRGEDRVLSAVKDLTGFPTLNQGLWFGFGRKHAIREVVRSTPGLNCVAVISALLEFYSTAVSAKIIRELLITCDAPPRLKPSLLQWISLVKLCGGAFGSTRFGVLIHDIVRSYHADGNPIRDSGASPRDMAKALSALVAVSNGSVERVQFVGGADCAWIAAFAIWFLDMQVEVIQPSGQAVFPSQENPQPNSTRVIVILGASSAQSLQIVSRSYYIASGEVLFRVNKTQRGVAHDNSLSFGRIPWENILRGTFGKCARRLIEGRLLSSLGGALGCAARAFTGLLMSNRLDEDDEGRRTFQKWEFISSSCHGHGFISSLRHYFPELSDLEMLIITMERSQEFSFFDAAERYDQAMQTVAIACKCNTCKGIEEEDLPQLTGKITFCLVTLVETVIELVLVLSSLSIPATLLPTRAGVEAIYWSRDDPSKRSKGFYSTLFAARQLMVIDMANLLFTGRQSDPKQGVFDDSTSAFACNGFCFYRNWYVGLPANPELCNHIHVALGGIEWNDHVYEEILDINKEVPQLDGPQYLAGLGTTTVSVSAFQREDSSSPDLRYDLLVEEDERRTSKALSTGYRFSTSKGRFVFGLNDLVEKIGRALGTRDCKGKMCRPLPRLDVVPLYGEGLIVSQGPLPGSSSLPLMLAVPKCVSAQVVAACQIDILSAQDGRLQQCAQPLLQGRQCLYCLLAQAVHETNAHSKSLCIVTAKQQLF